MDVRWCENGSGSPPDKQCAGRLEFNWTHAAADYQKRIEELEKKVKKLQEEIQELLKRPSILKSPSSGEKKVRFSLNNGEQQARPTSAKRAAPKEEDDPEVAKLWEECPDPVGRKPRGWKKLKQRMEQEDQDGLWEEDPGPLMMRTRGWAKDIVLEEDIDNETKMKNFVDTIMSRDQDCEVVEIKDEDDDKTRVEDVEEWNDEDRAKMEDVEEWRPASPPIEIPSQFSPSDLFAPAPRIRLPPSSPATAMAASSIQATAMPPQPAPVAVMGSPPAPTAVMGSPPPRSPKGKGKAPSSPLQQMTLVDEQS
ncbi:hypothetical protein F4678DRAFT_464644 [Xylaria arbuscula]|nr:hypothetical protein F4678DRAFT_464644 [Xylaria arbuscula]